MHPKDPNNVIISLSVQGTFDNREECIDYIEKHFPEYEIVIMLEGYMGH